MSNPVRRRDTLDPDQYEVKEPLKSSKSASVARSILKTSPSSGPSEKRVSFGECVFLKPQYSLITDTVNPILLGLVVGDNASSELLEKHPFTNEEMASVRVLDFSDSDLTDDRLIVLIRRFPHVREVFLATCSNLTDASISQLSLLPRLDTVQILLCPKVTEKGISSLPLEQLKVFGLSSQIDIPLNMVQRLAKSATLRAVDFSFCSRFTKEALFCFKECLGLQRIKIKGCNIDPAALAEVNRGRNGTFIEIVDDDLDVVGPDYLPSLPNSNDVFRMSSKNPIFANRSELMMPHESVIETFKFPVNLRGFDLTGIIPQDSVSALIKRFPGMEWVRVYDTKHFDYAGLITLAQLTHIRVLYLGLLSDITSRGVEVMFSQQNGRLRFAELRELYFCQMPVSDWAMHLIGGLPKLEKATFSDCSPYTVRGLFALVKGCKSLKHLTLIFSIQIDPFAVEECRALRPDMEIFTDEIPDLSAIHVVADEADQRMRDQFKREFIFITGITESSDPIPENGKIDLDPEEVSQYYESQMEVIGIDLDIKENEDLPEQWMRCDQTLQSFVNINRTLWALRQELIRIGFFTNQDVGHLPSTAKEILEALEIDDLVRKVQRFDFSGLEITALPYYILDREWPQLKEIHLDGTLVKEVPDAFKAKCPKLRRIVYSHQKVEVLETPLSPRTSHLMPPVDMRDEPTASKERQGLLAKLWKG